MCRSVRLGMQVRQPRRRVRSSRQSWYWQPIVTSNVSTDIPRKTLFDKWFAKASKAVSPVMRMLGWGRDGTVSEKTNKDEVRTSQEERCAQWHRG